MNEQETPFSFELREDIKTKRSPSLEIKGNECPSLEAQVGMQVAWTNRDNVDHILVLERTDDNGVLIDSGGTDLLQPGSTYSITLIEPGQYTYYCSEDRAVFGTITVLP